MVTRRAAGVLRPIEQLILATDMTATPLDASLVPSSIRIALADPHWRRAMEEEYAIPDVADGTQLYPSATISAVAADPWGSTTAR
jgi:hypothetical protein